VHRYPHKIYSYSCNVHRYPHKIRYPPTYTFPFPPAVESLHNLVVRYLLPLILIEKYVIQLTLIPLISSIVEFWLLFWTDGCYVRPKCKWNYLTSARFVRLQVPPKRWFRCVGTGLLVPVCWYRCVGMVCGYRCVDTDVLVPVCWYWCVGTGVPDCAGDIRAFWHAGERQSWRAGRTTEFGNRYAYIHIHTHTHTHKSIIQTEMHYRAPEQGWMCCC
jgi:hypothetical protein